MVFQDVPVVDLHFVHLSKLFSLLLVGFDSMVSLTLTRNYVGMPAPLLLQSHGAIILLESTD